MQGRSRVPQTINGLALVLNQPCNVHEYVCVWVVVLSPPATGRHCRETLEVAQGLFAILGVWPENEHEGTAASGLMMTAYLRGIVE